MKIATFQLEDFYEKHEFNAPWLLSQSDCQSLSIAELLALEPDAEERFLQTWLGYTESHGDPQLRAAIAALYEQTDPEDILVHSGAEEAIFNFMQVFLEPGDHLICLSPAYQSLYEVAISMGCEVSTWQLRQDEHGWALDQNELLGLIKANTRLLVINTPHNPTGFSLSDQQLRDIANITQERGIFVFCDQVYKGLEWDGQPHSWFCDLSENSVSLGVMSKAYGLPGLRIGWLATRDRDLCDRLLKFKYYTTICNSAPAEFLATVALKHSYSLLERNVAVIRGNLALAQPFFDQHSELFGYNPPLAGPVGFHAYRGNARVDAFCEQLLQSQGVLLLPGTVYGVNGYFRMGYGRRDFSEGLTRLGAFLA